MRFYDQGQGNLLERFQQALRGGMGRRSLGIARIQSRQGSAFLGQLTTRQPNCSIALARASGSTSLLIVN
jgi:hypothetical protein